MLTRVYLEMRPSIVSLCLSSGLMLDLLAVLPGSCCM